MVCFVAGGNVSPGLTVVTTPGFYAKPHLAFPANVFSEHIVKKKKKKTRDSGDDEPVISHKMEIILT